MYRQLSRLAQLMAVMILGCLNNALATETLAVHEANCETFLLPIIIFLVIFLAVFLTIQRKRVKTFEQKIISSNKTLEITLEKTKREIDRVRQACELASLIYYEYNVERGVFTGDNGLYNLFVGEARSYLTHDEILSHIHPEDVKFFNAYKDISNNTYKENDDNIIKVIVRIFGSNGEQHYLHVYAKSVFDSDEKLICRRGCIIDVTEQKKKEIELSIINKQLQYVQRMAKIYTWEIHINQPDIIKISGDFYKLLGSKYDGQNEISTSVLRDVLSGEDYNTIIGAINSCFITGKPFDITVPIYPKSGADVMYIHIVSFISENQDARKGIISGVFQDITDIKNSEFKAGHEQKIKALGRLASSVAHDFNNQLSGILGFADLIKSEEISDKVREYANVIFNRGEKSVELVRKLLDFSRNQKEKVELINVDALLIDTIGFFSHLVNKSVEVKKEINVSGQGVLGNYNELQNALLNLCINARDALDFNPGSITLSVSSRLIPSGEARKLQVTPGKFLIINVIDTGHGMTDEVKKMALEPFFTTKPEGNGTGLGLSTVHSTITALAGAVDIKSKVNEGTTVSLYLPIASDSQFVKEEEHIGKGKIKNVDGNVLIIDDDKSLVKLLTMQLNKIGYIATGIDDPKEAVRVYATDYRKYDLVILDMIMPTMNGVQVYNALIKINKEVKVIMMSAYSDDELFEEVRRNGLKHFLTKPVTLTTLTKKVAEVLNDNEWELNE